MLLNNAYSVKGFPLSALSYTVGFGETKLDFQWHKTGNLNACHTTVTENPK